MIDLREIVYGLYGGYRLCRFDSQGLAYFNATESGFWRSFFAFVLIAPVHLLRVLVHLGDIQVQASAVRVALIEVLVYIILVFAYPLAAFYLSELLDRRHRYITYIVAYNWAGVIQTLLLLPADALRASTILPPEATFLIDLAANILVLAILWFIARVALQTSALAAAGLVVVDVVILLIVTGIGDGRLAVG